MSDRPQGPQPGPRLTAEQAAAVQPSGASVALSASAGCGKTTVLTERYLAELRAADGRPLESVVALTFTEKAARELKTRIRARLGGMLGAQADHAESLAWRLGLEAAPIGTFHEYCGRLVRNHAALLGIDPDFAILDESIAAALREEAVDRSIRQLLEQNDADLVELAIAHGPGKVRDGLVSLLRQTTAAELETWAKLSSAEIVARWHGFHGAEVRPRLLEDVLPLLRRVQHLMLNLATSHEKLTERREAVLKALEPVLGDAANPSREQLVLLVEQIVVRGTTDKHWPTSELYQSAKILFEGARKILNQTIERWPGGDASTDLAAAEESLAFTRLALHARQEYQARKARHGGLDFDDLLERARVLVDRESITRPDEIEDRIDVVLVDEFQDTDVIQGRILEDLGGQEFATGRLFVVGDVKQSIYRFRGATPALFGGFRQSFPEAGRLELTGSFRSTPGITGFVNALFRGCFDALDPVSAAREGGYDLRPIRGSDVCQPVVEFVWTVSEEGETEGDENTTERKSAGDLRHAEAATLAARLRDRLNAGWMVEDRATRQIRPARPGDIALLFRAMTDVSKYEDALALAGFDFYTVGGSAFYVQQEIRDVVNLLAAVEDPLDELALAGLLRSPFFGLSDDALFHLARTGEQGLVRGLEQADATPHLPPLDRTRAQRARALLARWRSLKDRMPMARLLSLMLDESGYEAALACEFLGERKLANTRKLVAIARSFDRQGGFSLGTLAARLSALLDEQAREEQAAASPENEDSIRLMTIHQAKGLEFPIVVIPDLGRAQQARSGFVRFHPELGILVASENDGERSLGSRTFQAIEQFEEEAESLRLFYVAATRARDALVISSSLKKKGQGHSPALKLLESRFDPRTGSPIGDALAGGPVSPVNVHIAAPAPEQSGSDRTRSAVPFDDLARIIEQPNASRSPWTPRREP